MNRRIVTAITGASGALYAARFVKACLEAEIDIDLVVTEYGHRLLIEELDLNLKTDSFEAWLDRSYGSTSRSGSVTRHPPNDLGATIASGSSHWHGMVVIPCSMKTLSGIAHGSASNLVERAADVTMKERRPLILVPRETPFNLVHIENMRAAALAGATIVPAMPAFYQQPRTLEDLADFVAGRVLSLLSVEHRLFPPWEG